MASAVTNVSVFRAIKSWLWSLGNQSVTTTPDRWDTSTYALPVFSAGAQARWRQAGAFSGAVWDSRHLQGQAIRLLRVKTIMQMEVVTTPYTSWRFHPYAEIVTEVIK